MSITKITTGKNTGGYRVRIQPIDPVTKKVIKIRSKTVSTRKEAQKLERQMWADYENKKIAQVEKTEEVFSTAFSNYCENEYKAGRWSYATYSDWNYTVRLVVEFFGKAKIKDINMDLIRTFARNYIASHKATVARNSTIDRRLQHLRQYFSILKEEGLVINPVPRNALKKFFRYDEFSITSEKYVFSEDEVISIKEEIISKLPQLPTNFWGSRIAILLALDTGMRPQEIQAVKWAQLIKDGT
ncbi:site-specific integrase [Lactobacillus mulieris]|uniref:Phage integrase SAM-like domain-containing protein n=1 Tax=Lactobacillus mulieris TaxID=2508708 RepID=A0AAW5WZH2_9LACO|nr:phage integrase SAM-like domain-containing protein [Lactobacillus mulieris]MCZ3622824.1 phage integrase SAM-like domain-containing protein [Lactobacillus mulieris]MCZ3624504.1 phage integrase SAM-like domain-containing protein [Lactobacillus mulieris]MCZ3636835.1 phage integrase SAM-like domain-containing protein [Lactobacillus mulieris]MCZ3690749.1 phage integrase SAM-like domain-containing protein [Lactobacillus mulieris]MCZ3696734.1 phage integrase SAM-like domain-containing protein [Lac